MTKQDQICEPIKTAVQVLESKGFEIVNSTLRDFHFNEYEIKLESKNTSVNTLKSYFKIQYLGWFQNPDIDTFD